MPSSSSSSSSFVEMLSRAFLAAAVCMASVVVALLIWDHTDESTLSSLLRSSSHHHPNHQWALARFGFPSAFEDSLYTTPRQQTCPPQRIHLTQATNVNGEGLVNMTLSFTLPYKECTNAVASVMYGRGLFPDGTSQEEEVIQFTYDPSEQVRPDLHRFQSDWIHHVTLPQIQAGRQLYWYRILVVVRSDDNVMGSRGAHAGPKILATAPEQDLWIRQRENPSSLLLGHSTVHTFMTPPLVHQPTSLALVGDLGQTENSTKTMNHILSATQPVNADIPLSALVIAGDLSYADGDPSRWTSWLELMEPLLRSLALFSVPGNHEIECDKTTHQVFGQYESYFRNPNRLGEADRMPIPDDYRRILWNCLTSSQFLGHYNYGNAFWSVKHGMVHIIALNSYTSTMPGSPQYTWLDQELQQVDRTETPWLLVFFHCPLHTTFLGHNGELNPLLMYESMESLFVEYQVNIVVSGHDHAYLRTKPMVGRNVDPKGPVYLTLGAGGNREQHNKGFIHDIPEEWVEKRDLSEYGFGRLQIPNATHAHLTWVRDGTTTEGIRDDVWLPNQYYL